jgi:hypothetical protein
VLPPAAAAVVALAGGLPGSWPPANRAFVLAAMFFRPVQRNQGRLRGEQALWRAGAARGSPHLTGSRLNHPSPRSVPPKNHCYDP